MTKAVADMTPVVDLTEKLGLGPRRWRRPIYTDLMPPCNDACPAGENIQGWLALVQAGKFRAAWELLMEANPMPSVHGRVCYHPCETACNRAQLDSAVSIHSVERFLGDLAASEGWTVRPIRPSSGKRVLVIGAGPSGLSAAYHLTRLGHEVEIHEAGPLPGGMLHFGIPSYRLPRQALMQEIDRIETLGVKIVLDHRVEDVLAEMEEGGFDAVFAAIGADQGKRVEIPARDAGKVLDAIKLLHQVETGEAPLLGRRVVVYGGGNTAMDAARTVRRLGASEPLIIYRRDRAHMPAHAFELEEAIAEGVKVKWLSTIRMVSGEDLTVEAMRLNAEGRPEPTGEIETLKADAVVLALGQETDSGFLKEIPGVEIGPDGTVAVGPNMMTGHPGIFAGGDMTPATRTVTTAVGHGKKAARFVDAWLRGGKPEKRPRPSVVSFSMLTLPIYTDAMPSLQRERRPEERVHSFAEVFAGLSDMEALHEARRCFSCGNCFECDNCFAACPEDAITKLGPGLRYRIELDRCTGCAVCVEQCPCHAMEMVPEPA
ncbi:MAG TPA: NAD(P)-binding protein [Terriglobia bacterium]|nr:NAD(P)-binding protein [Terriglobia bacterium]